jgi:hypothetical protein
MFKKLVLSVIFVLCFINLGFCAGTNEVSAIDSILNPVKNQLMPILIDVIVSLIGLGLIALVGYGLGFLRNKFKSDKLNFILDKIEIFLVTRIKANEATIAKDLKERLAKGELNKEAVKQELIKIGKSDIEEVTKILGTEGIALLDKEYGNAKKFLQDTLDRVVEEGKK